MHVHSSSQVKFNVYVYYPTTSQAINLTEKRKKKAFCLDQNIEKQNNHLVIIYIVIFFNLNN